MKEMKTLKILAMYLPQFHSVPENDEWWGEGFTDWISAKNARPLFEGHYQPHVPLNENYYDLLDKQTMEWQADLMHQYGIDGMCMYHYWFKDGRQILEKPAENLLKWTDIHMPFCFCWANETWARSWSGIMGSNAWCDAKEPVRKEGDKAILLEQAYGTRKQWKQHFEYLLPFFRDDRYIKIEGKPVFIIYKTNLISCLSEMLEYWRELAEENGLSGIYVIGSNCTVKEHSSVDAEVILEPAYTISLFKGTKDNWMSGVETYDYDMIWEQIIKSKPRTIKTYFSGIVGYDDTPRRERSGKVLTNQSPESFYKHFMQLLAKSENCGNEFVFLNAWNEWGEGMHLEPDQNNGFAYLEMVAKAKKNYKNVEQIQQDDFEEQALRALCNKFENNMNVLDSWLTLKENEQSLVSYFETYNYSSVAMYGYGMLGRHFIKEMDQTPVSIQYIIDKQGDKIKSELPVYTPDAKLPDVDVVVISLTFGIEDIKNNLQKKGLQNIVTLEEIIRAITEDNV